MVGQCAVPAIGQWIAIAVAAGEKSFMSALTPDPERLWTPDPFRRVGMCGDGPSKGGSAAREMMTQEQYGEGYRRGFDLTVRLLVSRGIDAAAAEEAAQGAWTRGWECRDQLRDPERLLSWVNSIALNLFRSEHRRPKAGPLPPEIPVTPRVGPWTIDLALVIEKCNPAERAMLQKHYLAGYTSSELAAQVGCTAGALRVRMLRLRRRLQAIMRRKRVGGKGAITARSAFEHGQSPSVQGI